MLNAFLLMLAGAAPPAVDTAFVRTTITVSDLEASRRFYVDGLGFTPGFDGDITSDSTRALLGLRPGQRAHFLVLRNAATVGGRPAPATGIGLLFLGAERRRPAPRAKVRPAVGAAMLAIETSDIAAVERRLRAVDARILIAPLSSHGGDHRELVVHDPDGVRIQVVEIVPPRK